MSKGLGEAGGVDGDRRQAAPLRWLAPLLLFFGIITAFITPPIQVADEDSHFIRAVMVSQLDLNLHTQGDTTGQMVPASLVDYVESHRVLATTVSERYSYDRWYTDSHKIDADQPARLHRYSAQSLSPLYYVPQVIGIWLGEALYAITPSGHYNWSAKLYFSRLGNLIFYVLVFAWAVRAAPRFGLTLAFLAATPMSLSLAASASYDVAVITGAVGFFVAVVRAAWREGGPRSGDVALIALLAFFLGHNKAVYAPLLLLIPALWPSIGLRSMLALAVSCGLLAIAGGAFSSVLFGLPANPALQHAVAAQADYVRENLGAMPGLVIASITHFQTYLFTSTIGSLGWLNANFPLPLLTAWAGVGLGAVVADASKGRAPRALSLTGLQALAVMIALFFLFIALYVTWSSLTSGIGGQIIDSVQGRYVLPLLPVFLGCLVTLLSLGPWPRPIDYEPWLKVCAAAMAFLMVFMLSVRYWV